MNLVPGSQFSLIRQIDNVNDTGTYYVRAVVRNINTGATMATLNLASKGNQRYSSPWQVPADTSGQGTYISITTYVFDDSGYSVPDQNYATEDKEYLIIQPPVSSYGNGGTTVVDYELIKKMVLEGIKFPGIPTYDKDFLELRRYNDGRFDGVMKAIGEKVDGIKFPRYDDSAVHASLSSLRGEMESMKKSHDAQMRQLSESHKSAVDSLKSRHEETLRSMSSEMARLSAFHEKRWNESDNLHRDIFKNIESTYQKDREMITGVVRSIPKEEIPKKRVDERVRKLMGT